MPPVKRKTEAPPAPPEPTITRWLLQAPDGRLRWSDVHPSYLWPAWSTYPHRVSTLAYGWSDGIVTWKETRD